MSLARLLNAQAHPTLAVLAQFLWIVQFGLVIHAYRTGRPYYWTWILFMAPGIGGIAYVCLELLPSISSPRGLWFALKPRKWRIRDLRADLEETDTVENRLALAEELFAAGNLTEAHDVAEESLRGVFKDDPHTLTEVAHYKPELDRYEEALQLLHRVDTRADRMLAARVELLTADALRGLDRFDEAEPIYDSLVNRYSGEAPRAGLALVYEHTGRKSEAVAVWKDIRTRFRRARRAWRRRERKWYRLATAKLKEQNRPTTVEPSRAS